MQGGNESQEQVIEAQIIEQLRRDVASDLSEHGESRG
jgi:hypothetical protein